MTKAKNLTPEEIAKQEMVDAQNQMKESLKAARDKHLQDIRKADQQRMHAGDAQAAVTARQKAHYITRKNERGEDIQIPISAEVDRLLDKMLEVDAHNYVTVAVIVLDVLRCFLLDAEENRALLIDDLHENALTSKVFQAGTFVSNGIVDLIRNHITSRLDTGKVPNLLYRMDVDATGKVILPDLKSTDLIMDVSKVSDDPTSAEHKQAIADANATFAAIVDRWLDLNGYSKKQPDGHFEDKKTNQPLTKAAFEKLRKDEKTSLQQYLDKSVFVDEDLASSPKP